MAKIRLRAFFSKYPVLDEMRVKFFVNLFTCIFDFFDGSYPILRCSSKASEEYLASGKQAILAIYHGRIIGMLRIVPDRSKVTILISHHRDGEVVARVAQQMGYSTARGSPTYKAVEGAMQMLKATQQGKSLMITVDGPRGPKYEVKSGVIRIAELAQIPIIPFVCRPLAGAFASWSWDWMMGGFWGCPMLYMVGDPIYVPADISDEKREEYRSYLEKSMERLRRLGANFWHQEDDTTFTKEKKPWTQPELAPVSKTPFQ